MTGHIWDLLSFFDDELVDYIIEMSNQYPIGKSVVGWIPLAEENFGTFWESLCSVVMYSSRHIGCIGKRHQMYNIAWLRMQCRPFDEYFARSR